MKLSFSFFPLGDCGKDEDCEKGLFCYRRTKFEMVLGCAGQGIAGPNYCFDPVYLGEGEWDF